MLPESNALYKIFLVEDEIVAREGIRDAVAWARCGFEFVGEAADGESALPLIQQCAPDLLITDIRMPFMDGLQLSRLVRERLPQTRIVILSGYDEFAYAQAAIALGVSEYILKPVSARDIEKVLVATRTVLDRERSAAAEQRLLASQVEDTRALQRRELLMRLCMGDMDPFEAVERSHDLGLEIVAPAYVVLVARGVLPAAQNADPTLRPRRLQQIQATLRAACANLPRVEAFRKDIEEVVLLVTGEDAATVRAQVGALVPLLSCVGQRAGVESGAGAATDCEALVIVGVGGIQQRLSDLPLSFATALDALQYEQTQLAAAAHAGAPDAPSAQLQANVPVQVDRQAAERYLRFGAKDEFDAFFTEYVDTLDAHAFERADVRNYLYMDMAVAAANCVRELGGDPATVIPDAARPGEAVAQIHARDELRTRAGSLFAQTIDFRDAAARQQHRHRLMRARAFIEQNADDAELSLTAVAAHVNVSPSHFSAIFSRETGETFKEFLTRTRMERAQGLLRSTALPIVEIAQRSGYSDPHYFSAAFKRVTGLPPRDYREARPAPDESAPA